ncbi:hypothetical protein INT45_002999 [Circinella minor]|uniref:Flavodoxin-like domain-containing protein n=1 Tax=Circinella minor TaxID=1195481 RepID=A0A8H7RX58_9FUNG|nr:hypothetical protein INT45_002999 [Circinella minor]
MSTPKVSIVIYTVYHHIYKLAVEAQHGLKAAGVQSTIYQVPETLPGNVLKAINAPPKPDVPIIQPHQITEADGLLFGLPTRFGTAPSQIKALLDGTGGLWAKNALAGKFAGQETTALTTIPYFVHHGINYVPLGFRSPHLNDNTEIVGGSPYGAGTITSPDGSRQPSKKELEVARTQGELFGNVVATYVRGRQH